LSSGNFKAGEYYPRLFHSHDIPASLLLRAFLSAIALAAADALKPAARLSESIQNPDTRLSLFNKKLVALCLFYCM
jgi:hypothetical protein